MKLSTYLYKAASYSRTAEVIASRNPKRIKRRAKNLILGRVLGGIFGRLRLWQ